MKFKHLAFIPILISALSFIACGDDAGNNGSSDENRPDIQVETSDDLPNCSKNREGEIAEVNEERKAYICEDGRWEFDHIILDSVKTEDDLSACLTKNEGDSVWVTEESAIFVCIDRKWEKQKMEEETPEKDSFPTYKSENDLPNCTKDRKGSLALVEDDAMRCNDGKWQDLGTAYETSDSVPNCTKKREGETAFILDEFQALVCNDGKWEDNDEVEEIVVKPEEKSSSSGKPDDKSSSSGKSEAGSSSSDKGEASSSSSSKEAKSSSSKGKTPNYDVEFTGSVTDTRDGKTYKAVKIGDQIWFAENLSYNDGHGLCPLKDAENCKKYGRLYNFYKIDESDFQSVCPDGWRIPDSLDWAKLISYVSENNGGEPVGVSLKATTGWISEGDSLFIEANENSMVSIDSTRIGATRGTDRFGFGALPAGSCWDDGGCYADDDTRFFFSNAQREWGGSFKLAFDKDDFMYSEDGAIGWISVRCLQNPYIEIDSMPPVVVIDTLIWMAEDLTHDGSAEFSMQDALYACPTGWRLPTSSELIIAVNSGKFKVSPETIEAKYFVSDKYYPGVTVTCDTYHCSATTTIIESDRHVRCISKDNLIIPSGCACSASELDSASNSVTWSVTSCKDDNNTITGYSWNFGSDPTGVTVSGAKATMTFDSFAIVAPSVNIYSDATMGGKDINITQRLSCPTVRVGFSESAIIFRRNEKVKLYEGTTYTATLDEECNENFNPRLECNSSSGQPISFTVNDQTYSGSAWFVLGTLNTSICSGGFLVSVSEDMECSMGY